MLTEDLIYQARSLVRRLRLVLDESPAEGSAQPNRTALTATPTS